MCSAIITINKEELRSLINATSDTRTLLTKLCKLEYINYELRDIDISKALRRLYELSTETKILISTWINYGSLFGISSSVYVTPLGSVVVDLDKCKSNIFDVNKVFEDLIKHGLALLLERYLYIPLLFKLCDVVDHVNDIILVNPVDVDDTQLPYFAIPQLLIEEQTAIEAYELPEQLCYIISKLGYYFGSKVIECIPRMNIILHSLASVRSYTIDLITLTEDSVIVHNIVNLKRTYRLGFSTLEHYIMQGFDKSILVHVYADKSTVERTLRSLLNRKTLKSCGYIALSNETEIGRIGVVKWCLRNNLIKVSRTIMERNYQIRNYIYEIHKLK